MTGRDGAWHCFRQAGRRPPFLYQSSTVYSSGWPPLVLPPPSLGTLHFRRDAGRKTPKHITNLHGDLESTTTPGLTGGHLKGALCTPVLSLILQLCAGCKTTRDVLRSSRWRHLVSVTQVKYDLSPTEEKGKKVTVVTGQAMSPTGSSKVPFIRGQ